MRHQMDESPDEYDLDLDNRSKGFGGRSGRIILLGDGTEVLTDADDAEMFDHSEEDKDLDSQVKKESDVATEDTERHQREDTPAPQSQSTKSEESPSSTTTNTSEENSKATIKAASDGPVTEPSTESSEQKPDT